MDGDEDGGEVVEQHAELGEPLEVRQHRQPLPVLEPQPRDVDGPLGRELHRDAREHEGPLDRLVVPKVDGEAVALDLAHIDLGDGGVRVRGKGDKERRVYLVDGARRALEWWLSLRGSDPGPVLYRVLKGGHIRPKRLKPAAIGIIVERRVREAALLRRATPHDFRRTFTGDLLDAGADLAAAQALLGHASPTTTARYDRRGERARRKAAELVAVPFSVAPDGAPGSDGE